MRGFLLALLLLSLPGGGKPGEAYNLGVQCYSRGDYSGAIFWWRLSWIRGQDRAGALINSLKRRLGIREGTLFRRAHPDLPAVLFLLALLSLLGYNSFLLYKRKKPSLWLELAFLFSVVLLLFFTLRERSYYLKPPLCVVAEKSQIYSAPSQNLPVEELLPGEEMRWLEIREGWVKVETPWGTIGWVKKDKLLVLK